MEKHPDDWFEELDELEPPAWPDRTMVFGAFIFWICVGLVWWAWQ